MGAHPSRIEAGAVIADVNGDGYQDVIVPTDTAVFVLDGRTGNYIAGPLGNNYAYQSSPAVENVPGGRILVMAGMQGGFPLPESDPGAYGLLSVYAIGQSNVASAWPTWRHDARRTGVADTGAPRPKWALPASAGLTLLQRAGAPPWTKPSAAAASTLAFDITNVASWSSLPPQSVQLHLGEYHLAA